MWKLVSVNNEVGNAEASANHPRTSEHGNIKSPIVELPILKLDMNK